MTDASSYARAALRTIASFLLSIALLVFIACSSSTHSSSSGSSAPAVANTEAPGLPEPCSLITKAEVESALGAGATMTAQDNHRTGMHECRMKAAKAEAMGEIVMIVRTADLWDATKKAMLSNGAKPVPGLGDDAFGGQGIGYNVRKGNKYVQVFVFDAAYEKATRYLAERASSRL